jgi:hypothetical protein
MCQQIHRATAWTIGILLSFHIIAMMEVTQGRFPLDKSNNLFARIVRNFPSLAGCVGGLLLFSSPVHSSSRL